MVIPYTDMIVSFVLSARLCFFTLINRDVFCNRGDSLTSFRVIMRTEQPTKCFVPLQELGLMLGS